MSEKVKCPNCNRAYAFKPEYAGKSAMCKCGSKIRFPDAPPAPVPAASQGTCPNCQVAMPQGSVLCTRCGYNKVTGRSVAGVTTGNTPGKGAASQAPMARARPTWAKLAVAAVAILVAGISIWSIYKEIEPSKKDIQTGAARKQPSNSPPPRAAPPVTPVDPNRMAMREIDGPEEGVNALAFSPSGKMLAAAGQDKLVHLYDVESGKELRKLEGHEASAMDVRFSPDESRIVSTGPDGLRIWETATGRLLQTIDPKGKVTQGRFIGNDQVVSAVGNKLMIWKIGEGQKGDPERVIDTGSEISCLDASSDGQHIVTGQSVARRIKVWDAANGRLMADHEQGPAGTALFHYGEQAQAGLGQVQETEFLDNDHILVGAREAGTYILEWKQEISVDIGIHLPNRDKPQLWAGDQERIIWNVSGATSPRFFDMAQGVLQSPQFRDRTGRMVPLNIGNIPVSCLALRGEWTALGSCKQNAAVRGQTLDASKIRLVKVTTMETALAAERQSIQRELDKVNADALARSQTPRGKLETAFVEAMKKATVPVAKIDVQGESMTHIHFSPDGKYLGGAGVDHVVRLYDTANWKEVKTLAGHSGAVVDISFSQDSKKLLSASSDSTIILWDVESGQIDSRVGSNSRVFTCGLLPDGKHAVTTGFYVQFWDMEHEKLNRTGEADNQIWGLAISAGGTVATMDNSENITRTCPSDS